jgi:NO-binding membrane sensor protein with MHYT domain
VRAWTLAGFAAERRAAGEPWVRMAVILGAVIAVTIAGAALLEARRLRERFARSAESGR